MRPAVDYTLEELIEFASLKDRTEGASEALIKAFSEVLRKEKLNEREAIYALASVVHHFIEEYDGEEVEGRSLDAEAAFNDYLLANMDISEEMLLGNLDDAETKGN